MREQASCGAWNASSNTGNHLEIFFQVRADARKRGDRCLGQLELLARELLVKVDIPSGRLEDHVRRNLRDLILIGIAARCYPATDEVLVKGVSGGSPAAKRAE